MSKFFALLALMVGGVVNLFSYTGPVRVDGGASVCRIEKVDYPIVGFGTYPLQGKICETAVAQAIETAISPGQTHQEAPRKFSCATPFLPLLSSKLKCAIYWKNRLNNSVEVRRKN